MCIYQMYVYRTHMCIYQMKESKHGFLTPTHNVYIPNVCI